MPRREPSKQRRGEFDLTQGGERQREKSEREAKVFQVSIAERTLERISNIHLNTVVSRMS